MLSVFKLLSYIALKLSLIEYDMPSIHIHMQWKCKYWKFNVIQVNLTEPPAIYTLTDVVQYTLEIVTEGGSI